MPDRGRAGVRPQRLATVRSRRTGGHHDSLSTLRFVLWRTRLEETRENQWIS